MSTLTIEVSSINSKKESFKSEQTSFKTNAYNTFKTGYISTCGDSTVQSMRSNLNTLYSRIEKGYTEIYDYWNNFIKDFDSLEKSLKSFSATCSNSSVNSFLSSVSGILPAQPNKATSFVEIIDINYNDDKQKKVISRREKIDTVKGGVKTTAATAASVFSSIGKGMVNWGKNAATFVLDGGLGYFTGMPFAPQILKSANNNLLQLGDIAVKDSKTMKDFEFYIDLPFYSNKTEKNNYTDSAIKEIKGGKDIIDYGKETKIGKAVEKNTALKEDSIVRGVAEGIGEALPTIGVAVVTGGGSAAMGITGFATGTGEGYGDALLDGASSEKAEKAGLIRGVFNGVSWYLGGKLNETGVAKSIATKIGLGKVAEKPITSSVIRVVGDAIDGASNPLTESLSKLVYRDGYKDSNGNYVKFDKNENAFDRYKKIFNEQGGWKQVIVGGLIGGVMSGTNEAIDFKLKKGDYAVDLDSAKTVAKDTSLEKVVAGTETLAAGETALTSILNSPNEVFASAGSGVKSIKKMGDNKGFSFLKRKTLDVVNGKGSNYTEVYKGLNLMSDSPEGLSRIKTYIDNLEKTKSSDFRSAYFIEKVKESGSIISNICDPNDAFYSPNTRIVSLGDNTLNNNHFSTFFHEFGHKVDNINDYYSQGYFIYNDAKSTINSYTINAGIEKFKSDFTAFSKKTYDAINNSTKYQDYIINESNKRYYSMHKNYNKKVYEKVVNDVKNELYDSLMRKSGFGAVSDIFDALTLGELSESSMGFYGHGIEYYTRDSVSASTEVIANFSDLYHSNNTDLLDKYLPKQFREKLTRGYEGMLDMKNINTKLNSFKAIHDLKHGSHSFEKEILAYIYDGNSIHITRDGGARAYIESLSKTDLMRYITSYDNSNNLLNYAKSITDKKYGSGSFNSILKSYLTTKNSNLLTRDKFIRNYISLLSDDQLRIWIDHDTILSKYFSIPGNLNSSKTTTKTVKNNNSYFKRPSVDDLSSGKVKENTKIVDVDSSINSKLNPGSKSTSDSITVIKKQEPKTITKTVDVKTDIKDSSDSITVIKKETPKTPTKTEDFSITSKLNPGSKSTSDSITVIKKQEPKTITKTVDVKTDIKDSSDSITVIKKETPKTPTKTEDFSITSKLNPGSKSTSDSITVIKKEEPKTKVKTVDTTIKIDNYKKDLNKAINDVSDELYYEVVKKDLNLPYSSTKVTQLIHELEDEFNDNFSKIDNYSKDSLINADSSRINKLKSKFIDSLNEMSMENGGSRITPAVEDKINQIFKTFDYKNQKLIQTNMI